MKTLGEVLQLSSSFLNEKKVDRPRRSAEELLAHILQLKRIELYMQYDRPIEERELASLRPLLKRLVQGEPVEYLVKWVEFYGVKIGVDRRALIPRVETEILVDLIAKRLRGKELWDLCSGTGCIGIALKKKFPELSVTLSDISADALELARENARLNSVDVEIFQGDLFTPFTGRRADLIVCNPPYVSESEFRSLDPSVRDFEPKIALIAGEKGTEFYERLAQEHCAYLNPGALLCLEIGADQGAAVKKIFSGGELLQDWSGADRFFFLEKQQLPRV